MVWQQIKFKIYRQVEGATCQCQTGACDLPAFSTKYSSVCTCTARLTYLESRHTKEEGKCLSASEHHRITPSYTDSTSELPLLFTMSQNLLKMCKFRKDTLFALNGKNNVFF